MSLYFVNSPVNHPVVARSVDDLYLRRPVLLAPHQANPLIDNINLQYLGPTWRLATTGREELLHGKRFENAAWRLWGQQLLECKKVERVKQFKPTMPKGRYWREKELWVPIVVSRESFHAKHELFLIKPTIDVASSPLVNAIPLAPKAATEDVLLLRTCLKGGTSSTFGSESPLSLRSSLPSSSPATGSASSRRVVFNSCVERSVIAAAPLSYARPGGDDSSLGLVFDHQYQDVYTLEEILDLFREGPPERMFRNNSSDEDEEFYPVLPTAFLDHFDTIVLRQRPGQIAPLPCSDSDPKTLYVPPKGMESLDETRLRPYEARPLRRRVQILDLSEIIFTEDEEEKVVKQLDGSGSGSNGSDVGGGLSRLASRDSCFTDGWSLDSWRAPAEDENDDYEVYVPFSDSEVGRRSKASSSAGSMREEGVDKEGEVVDGEMYYDCEEDIYWDEGYDYADSDDEEAPNGLLVIATVLFSFF